RPLAPPPRPGCGSVARLGRFVPTPRRSAPRRHSAPLSRWPPRRSLASSLPVSQVEAGEELLVVQDLVLVFAERALPDLLIPDAELLDIARDHDVAPDTRVFTQQRRTAHPAPPPPSPPAGRPGGRRAETDAPPGRMRLW